MNFKTLAALAVLTPAAALAAELPAPLKALEGHGAELVRTFDTGTPMKGYLFSAQGQFFTAYLDEKGQYAIVGAMLDSNGNNASESVIAGVEAERLQDAWASLEKSNWVAEGSDKAERIVYTFTDPNCPFCHRFWEAAQPWVKAGKVQLRHVVVAILRPDSLNKAAAIMADRNPGAAMGRHNQSFNDGGITPANAVDTTTRARIMANNDLMRNLGVTGTPASFYLDNGATRMVSGFPRGDQLQALMGSPQPR